MKYDFEGIEMLNSMRTYIKYEVQKSKRAKRVRLTVYNDGKIVVICPYSVKRSFIDEIIVDKEKWIREKLEFFKRTGMVPIQKFSKTDYVKHKGHAFDVVNTRVDYLNKFYGYSFNRICIRNQKTRWGSCSKKGNLNFNYKILFLPENLQDYIIVHELCHLKELNHSKKFWELVSKTVPDYIVLRKSLRIRQI